MPLMEGKPKYIGILVGADYYWSIRTEKFKPLSSTGVSSEAKFGWTLHGRFSNRVNSSNNLVSAMHVSIFRKKVNLKVNHQTNCKLFGILKILE
ncbi:hypothetical protein TNCT_220591 [Trichonephila clavata]|uniref:Uncharacterized protein n=1 Tax=Trichonephila clavata TaxID=2740835 RepID=A0A8X6KHW6_TRICU|nr:hypothetical protein TNCT_220591 [Trichonephila clavata]